LRYRRIFGGAFAISSVLVPFCLGAVAGGIASGHVPAGGQAGDPVHSWLNPVSLATGVLGVVLSAYLAAVYLVWDARCVGDEELATYFRRRAVVAAVAAALATGVGLVAMHTGAAYVFAGIASRALAPALLSVLCGLGALVLLNRGGARGARPLAVLAVAGVIITWGVAQWPYLLPESLTVADAAAPAGTLGALTVAVVLLVVLIVPAFALLYHLDRRQLLPEEGVVDVGDPAGS
jgi:cytochrome d ubiquinol oxidase subunit II